MACSSLQEKTLFILSYLTCIALIQCRSLWMYGDGSNIFSKRYNSDQDGYGSFVNFRNDAGVSDLQNILYGQLVSYDQGTWDAMSPKLRCRDNLMQLQLSGPRVRQVELCRGNYAPVPLTRLPPLCGQVTLTNRGLVYTTPYDGCGVEQQEGSYLMRVQWHGKPILVSCHSLEGPFPTPMIPVPTASAVAQAPPQPPGYPPMPWPYLYPYYYGQTQPTVAPVTTTTTPAPQAPTQKPQPPAYPPMFWPYLYPYYYGQTQPTVAPVTTTTTPAPQAPTQKPQLPAYPPMFWPYLKPNYYVKG